MVFKWLSCLCGALAKKNSTVFLFPLDHFLNLADRLNADRMLTEQEDRILRTDLITTISMLE